MNNAKVIVADLKDELNAAIDEINNLRERVNKDLFQPVDYWDKEGVHSAQVWLANNRDTATLLKALETGDE
jgi:hypothetical protein